MPSGEAGRLRHGRGVVRLDRAADVLSVTVELAPGEAADAARERVLAESIRAQLQRLNSEFAHYVPAGGTNDR